jgi:hypothetical protein
VIYVESLEKKQRRLELLKQRLEVHEKIAATDIRQMKILKRRARISKLIRAGEIFEEAGILDKYDHDDVLDALRKLKGY